MIKSWNQFIREFVESDNYIDAKMSELKDLIEGVTGGQNIIYEWENKNDHQLTVSFSTDGVSAKYEFDIDDLRVTKTVGESIDFDSEVDSVEEGLELIERDVQSILGISESYRGEWDSSIKYNEAEEVWKEVNKLSKIDILGNTADAEGLHSELENRLQIFDKETIETVIDIVLYNPGGDKDWIIEEIIRTGDKIMNKWGTEPSQVINAFDVAFRTLSRHFNWEENTNERVKAQRYKGRKIPGKYLTANPGKMKKEIDRFVGKKEYKKDWDADYKSGKGGKGKRVKTKKSAATKAYQRMFGKKESLTENNLLEFFYFIDKMSEKFDSESEEGSSSYIRYNFDENSDHITLEYGWSTYEEGGSEDMKIFWKENPIRVEWNEGQHTVYGDYDNQNTYKFNDFSELMDFIKEKYT